MIQCDLFNYLNHLYPLAHRNICIYVLLSRIAISMHIFAYMKSFTKNRIELFPNLPKEAHLYRFGPGCQVVLCYAFCTYVN